MQLGVSSSPLGTLDDVGSFARELNLEVEVLSFMRELPGDLRTAIIANFDPTGTKDGNVLGRLQAYVRHMMRKSGYQPLEQLQSARQQQQHQHFQPQLYKEQQAALGGPGGCLPTSSTASATQTSGGASTQSYGIATGIPGAGGSIEPAPGLRSEPVWRFAEQLGLGEHAADLLGKLPEDLQASVLRGFDPSGTKDGNVWGRLLGYVRSLWSRRLGLQEPVSGFIRGLPEEIQIAVIADFDASGSKDGNVSARLVQFTNFLLARGNLTSNSTSNTAGKQHPVGSQPHSISISRPSGAGLVAAAAAAAAPGPGTGPSQSPSLSVSGSGTPNAPGQQPLIAQQPLAAFAGAGALSEGAMTDFAQALGLDAGSAGFLQALPEPIQSTIVTQFDPSGTKDGNIWGRLFAFVRRLSVKYAGVGQIHIDHVKTLPEEEQRRIILEWTCPGQHRQEEQHLHLGQQEAFQQQHQQLLQPQHQHQSQPIQPMHQQPHQQPQQQQQQQLRQQQQNQHLSQFTDSSGFETGVTERAVRSFSQSWGLDGRAECFLQALPDAIRQHVLAGFDGSASKDGNVWGRLLGFARHTWARTLGLDSASVAFIKGLPEEAQMICLTDFDPSGTKDGNIAGRLQGFAKKALAQAGQLTRSLGTDPGAGIAHHPEATTNFSVRMPAAGAAAGVAAGVAVGVVGTSGAVRSSLSTDPLVAGFLERCGLDISTMSYLESLPEDVLARVLNDFDPSGTKDGNVLGRLQGYVRFLNARRKRSDDDLGGALVKRPRMAGV